MNTKKIITGKEAGLTLQECIDDMEGRVYQYKVAGKAIYESGLYRRGRNCRPIDGGHRAAWDVYILTEDGIDCLLYNTKKHRAEVAIHAYRNGLLDNIDYSIWNNYITNGWNTRIGLFRSNKRLERIKQIERSHADYLGNETYDSTTDHNARIALRN